MLSEPMVLVIAMLDAGVKTWVQKHSRLIKAWRNFLSVTGELCHTALHLPRNWAAKPQTDQSAHDVHRTLQWKKFAWIDDSCFLLHHEDGCEYVRYLPGKVMAPRCTVGRWQARVRCSGQCSATVVHQFLVALASFSRIMRPDALHWGTQWALSLSDLKLIWEFGGCAGLSSSCPSSSTLELIGSFASV